MTNTSVQSKRETDYSDTPIKYLNVWEHTCIEAMKAIISNPVNRFTAQQVAEAAMQHADSMVEGMELAARHVIREKQRRVSKKTVTHPVIIEAMGRLGGNKAAVAHELGVSLNTVYNRWREIEKLKEAG